MTEFLVELVGELNSYFEEVEDSSVELLPYTFFYLSPDFFGIEFLQKCYHVFDSWDNYPSDMDYMDKEDLIISERDKALIRNHIIEECKKVIFTLNSGSNRLFSKFLDKKRGENHEKDVEND